MTQRLDPVLNAPLYAKVNALAAQLGLDAVELRVSRRRGVNAWVPGVGSSKRITFTRRQLKERDLDWTIAHELAHLAAPADVKREFKLRRRLFAFTHFSVAALICLMLEVDGHRIAVPLAGLAMLALETAAMAGLFATHRREEYRADAVASRLVGPRLSSDFLRHPAYVDGRLERLLARVEYWLDTQIHEPTLLGRLVYLFQTHPTISERAQALGQAKPGIR